MDTVLTLGDALGLLLGITGTVLIILLIIAVSRINTVVGDLGHLIKKNKENINVTLQSLPEITGNVEALTGDIKNGVDNVAKAVESIQKNTEDSLKVVNSKADLTIDIIQTIGELIKTGIAVFGRSKA
jgi:uncharacterized protein YoxC